MICICMLCLQQIDSAVFTAIQSLEVVTDFLMQSYLMRDLPSSLTVLGAVLVVVAIAGVAAIDFRQRMAASEE